MQTSAIQSNPAPGPEDDRPVSAGIDENRHGILRQTIGYAAAAMAVYSFWDFAPMVIDLISPLPREACVRSLSSKVGTAWDGSTVIGSVGETSFRLRKRIFYRNSFQASLSGKFIDDPRGTRLRCRVGLHPFVTVFLTIWIGIVLVGCIWMIVSLVSGAVPANRWPQAAIPFLMLAGGVALLKVGQFLSRDEADFLIDFLRKTVDARDSERMD
jgi:hypothetical protein